jgi:hypothetical protein
MVATTCQPEPPAACAGPIAPATTSPLAARMTAALQANVVIIPCSITRAADVPYAAVSAQFSRHRYYFRSCRAMTTRWIWLVPS